MTAESNVLSSEALESLGVQRPVLGSCRTHLGPPGISSQASPLSTKGSWRPISRNNRLTFPGSPGSSQPQAGGEKVGR